MPKSDADRIGELQAEVAQLREAVASHAVVDQAIGMMVALGRVAPEEGWEVLKDVSQHSNIKLRNIAELILIWGRRGEIPADVGARLEDALERYGPTQVPGSDPGPRPAQGAGPAAEGPGRHA
ncbi:ANTAR domain-containing protein [Streptomyces collinus]|uniref:ANTAR domain-containing protein n=1 Tax=Streptomyces collinus TaxID=42684 RepID=UPI00333332C9